MSLKSLFLGTAAVNAATAAFNLLGTVLMVRWFGASVYADYLVDLAYLSLVMIVLELVPSNHSLFRVQDDPTRIRGLAALAVASAFVLAAAAGIAGYGFGLFHANSIWIIPYASLMAVKRYLDIRLQSSGRLREYFGIELRSAVIRLMLMGLLLWWVVNPVDAVWASLACATFLTQMIWFAGKPDERSLFNTITQRSSWMPLLNERQAYTPYYLGIALKRVRDNMVPILASSFFVSREALAAFFLAYRGLLFTLGQIRVIEGLLNHRQTLSAVFQISFLHRATVAFVAQIICILASILLILVSGVSDFNLPAILILSCVVWFYVLFVAERAKAYSNYETLKINLAMVTYCSVLAGLSYILVLIGLRTEYEFGVILICAEAASLLTIRVLKKQRVDLDQCKQKN
jgi:hypothetical protein